MNENDRRRFESIESLRQAAYSSFNDRRMYEWKLNIAIWTALAIVIAGLLQPAKTGETLLLGSCSWIYALGFGLAIVFLHLYWSNGAARANGIDKGVALHYSKAMRDAVALPFDDELKIKISNLPKGIGWYQWSHLSQIAITAALALATVILIYVRAA